MNFNIIAAELYTNYFLIIKNSSFKLVYSKKNVSTCNFEKYIVPQQWYVSVHDILSSLLLTNLDESVYKNFFTILQNIVASGLP